MRLRVLASGSSGNGYILYNDREALVIECGVPYQTCLKALGFQRGKILGALVTHEHGDHAKYVEQYLEGAVNVFMSAGTESCIIYKKKRRATAIEQNKVYSVGRFRFLAFGTQHDCKEPVGFLIRHPEMGQTLFATDTYFLKHRFEGLNHVMIECNYDNGIIDKNVDSGDVHPIVRDRVNQSHMSLETCVETLLANDLTEVNDIVLVHLSSHNSDPDMFKSVVEAATGKLVTIARKGVDIPFDKEMI